MRRWVGAYRAQERSDLACPACAACGVRDPHLAYSERGPLRDLPARHWMRMIHTLALKITTLFGSLQYLWQVQRAEAPRLIRASKNIFFAKTNQAEPSKNQAENNLKSKCVQAVCSKITTLFGSLQYLWQVQRVVAPRLIRASKNQKKKTS